jgi:hypothetical protein
MAFRLVSSQGEVSDASAVNLYASGVVKVGHPVDFLRTSGSGVGPSSSSSTTTMIYGVSLDYVQGASDTQVRVIRFTRGQLWEVDCANAASTAQIGIRHALSASRDCIHNTATDVTGNTGVFLAVAMTGLTTGSGKLIGEIISNVVPVGQNQTTFA